MNITINHDINTQKLWVEEAGHMAYLTYKISGDTIYVVSIYLPLPLQGRGIASRMMRRMYDYASDQEYRLQGVCSYARAWLERHTEAIPAV